MGDSLMGWRRNRKKHKKRGGQQPDLLARRKPKQPNPERQARIAEYRKVDRERPGPLMAEARAIKQARNATSGRQPAQIAPETPQQPPGPSEESNPGTAPGTAVDPPHSQGVQGAQPESTALFEQRGATRSDAGLVKRAVRKRWETDKRMAEAILTKIGLKALEDKLTEAQLLGAGKLMLDIERQNQAEEHHTERMDYAERALQHRIITSGSPVPTVGVGVRMTQEGGGSSEVGIQIYVPDNGREERGQPIVDEIVANP